VSGNGVGSFIIALVLNMQLLEQWSEDMPRYDPEFKAHQLKVLDMEYGTMSYM
jgi:hypothetical protein